MIFQRAFLPKACGINIDERPHQCGIRSIWSSVAAQRPDTYVCDKHITWSRLKPGHDITYTHLVTTLKAVDARCCCRDAAIVGKTETREGSGVVAA